MAVCRSSVIVLAVSWRLIGGRTGESVGWGDAEQDGDERQLQHEHDAHHGFGHCVW